MEESSRKYTAFIVPDGMYEFLRAPFGLCNSPAIFQKYINIIFKDLIREHVVLIYMDDLIIPANNVKSGISKLERVFKVASKAGLRINWKKCVFLRPEVEFLGHVIVNGNIRPSDRKTEAVKCFSEPTSVIQLQRFIGLTSYFRKFIPNYASIARPLTNLLRANVEFRFGEAEHNAFIQLKMLLCEKPVLALYRHEEKRNCTQTHRNGAMEPFYCSNVPKIKNGIQSTIQVAKLRLPKKNIPVTS